MICIQWKNIKISKIILYKNYLKEKKLLYGGKYVVASLILNYKRILSLKPDMIINIQMTLNIKMLIKCVQKAK